MDSAEESNRDNSELLHLMTLPDPVSCTKILGVILGLYWACIGVRLGDQFFQV